MSYLVEDLMPEISDSNMDCIVEDFMFHCGYSNEQANQTVVNLFNDFKDMDYGLIPKIDFIFN